MSTRRQFLGRSTALLLARHGPAASAGPRGAEIQPVYPLAVDDPVFRIVATDHTSGQSAVGRVSFTLE